MYIKIVKRNGNASLVGPVEKIREVKEFAYLVMHDDSGINLRLRLDGEEVVYSENDSITVYVMNDNGKTIDKIEWDYSIIHPEIMA
jgi:hypothetical protein